jgi:hypothetical protein
LISSTIWLIIGLYTLLIPISNILNNVNLLKDDINNLKYNYINIYNPQTIDTDSLNWWKIIWKYIDFLNLWDYQNACSLISTLQCTMYDVWGFTNWVSDKKKYLTVKLRDWEKLVKVWDSGEKLENINTEIWCWKIEYYMWMEDRVITEIRQYNILTRPDWKKEIWKIMCEKAVKDWNDRTIQMCGKVLEKKICTK